MNEYMNTVLALFKQFIAAATPVAKQAYDIGLLTLQVDAAGNVGLALLFLMVGGPVLYLIIKYLRKHEDGYMKDGTYVLCIGGIIISIIFMIISVVNLLNVWLWVKLFRPELWLAHMAIEKLVK